MTLPQMMKCAFRERYSSPDELSIREVSRPSPKKDEVLVRVHCTTVNRTGYALLAGKPFILRFFTGLFRPKLPITGTDFAGQVVDVGSDVSEYEIGDRVYGFRDEGLASHAEFVAIPKHVTMMKIPDGIDDESAVASLEGAHYAVYMITHVEVAKGFRVMLNGATGAIGSAALQILKHMGAEVVATCPGAHVETIRSLGANEVIDFEQEDFTQREGGFDFILDSVGKSSFSQCKRLLNKDGVYISSELGPGGENLYLPITTRWFGKHRVAFPLPGKVAISMQQIRPLLVSGAFRPLIDRRYSLDEIADAFKYVNTGQKIGNVLINIRG